VVIEAKVQESILPDEIIEVKERKVQAIKIDPTYLPALTAYVYMTFRLDEDVKSSTFESRNII